jgi:hypothetical protein
VEDEPEQEALFYIEGPDERGCVWMHGTSSRDPWAQNLGPCRKVVEALSQWLGEIDARDNEAQGQSRRERMDAWNADVARLDKAERVRRIRKIAKRTDHREEGGQG